MTARLTVVRLHLAAQVRPGSGVQPDVARLIGDEMETQIMAHIRQHVRVDADIHHHLSVIAKIRRTTTQGLVALILRDWASLPAHSVEAEMRRSTGGE